MQKVKSFSYNKLNSMLLGKKIHFTSDCELFPRFNVTGRVMSSYMAGTELVFKFKDKSGKTIDIGSNMKNLKFELI